MRFLDMADPVWDVSILRDAMRELQKEVHDLHWELAAVRVRMLREIRRLSTLVVVTNPLLVVMFPFSFFIPTLICWTWAEGPPKTASLLLQGRDRPWKRAIFSYQSSPFSDEKSKVQLRCDFYECMFSVSDFGKSNLNPLLKSASDQRRTMRFSTSLFSCVSILILVLKSISFTNANTMDVKVLRVGQELMKETLPLQSGSRLYELQGLNSNKWYEVKISYPASIPATFTLQLSKGSSGLNVGRKLLNTEKIIFQGNNLQLLRDKGGTFVLVNVEPEGIVSIPGVKERKHIIYNIGKVFSLI
ncbi:hypothetical protein CQW23_02444 [Capsicum baccatum]|uniref:Uncharacterized protein n=1 Tax=Capsicum baccatum TaxID=33114 RepID=A0A2G2XRU7_CAPBA|nr:hypothetical protein CQW23_02444 [Capsicum baccatum]